MLRGSKHGVPASNLSPDIPRLLGFLAPPSWCCFYPAFVGQQGVDLVPLNSDSGVLWAEGLRNSLETLMKATGFLLIEM